MCERKASGRCNVTDEVAQQYKNGGEGREILEMALLECIGRHGLQRSSYKRIKAYILKNICLLIFDMCFQKTYIVFYLVSVDWNHVEGFTCQNLSLATVDLPVGLHHEMQADS